MLTNKRVTINNDIVQNKNVLNFKPRDLGMNHYQRLVSQVNSLILENATREIEGWYLNFDDLNEDDQGSLVVLKLEEDERDTSECFHNPEQYAKDDNITCALIKLLKDNSPDNREDFAEVVRQQSIRSYKTSIQHLIDRQCGSLRSEWIGNKGFNE